MIVIADYRKKSRVLGQQWKKGIPVEVVPMAYVPVMNKMRDLGLDPVLRMAQNKAGPVVSDNGNFVVDAKFSEVLDWDLLESKLSRTPGVVETGLFIGYASVAYFGMDNGSVEVVEK